MLAQGLVEVLLVVAHVFAECLVGLRVAPLIRQQAGLQRLAGGSRAPLAGQHLQRQLFLAATLQRPGPGLLQARAGFRVAQLPIQRLCLIQGAQGAGPVVLGVERHGLIAEDDGSVIRRQLRVAEQVVQQPPGLGGSIGIDRAAPCWRE